MQSTINPIFEEEKTVMTVNDTSYSIDDPVLFVTVTIFSKTSREALRSPALISLVDDVRFFISCNVLLIDTRTFSVFCIPSSIMLSN